MEASKEPVAEGGSAELQQTPKPVVRMDFYQTDSDVVVTIFLKNQKQDEVSVDYSTESFRLAAKYPDGSDYLREVHLAKRIRPDDCSFKVLSTKIEIKLHKQDGGPWATLEVDKSSNKEFKPLYPSSSKKKFDWDKVEKDIAKQEKDDPDADINSLFSKIFESGDENTKKAMMKSMQESGGTVLSTNWEEVGKKRVEISPPDGMEFKKY
ncbi:protein SGT1 homolog [Folsomia candida]|uniref:Protein SGT1 A n=1 Tax=Folsomia candida TaxID=158441 RepID=A0A226ETR3_FOLCA|nr:protein SGT1 homolog [Folsomia candida]OXA60537.1 Protein SGT1 A [Folsomia candida]